jgi:hypothetical protein
MHNLGAFYVHDNQEQDSVRKITQTALRSFSELFALRSMGGVTQGGLHVAFFLQFDA